MGATFFSQTDFWRVLWGFRGKGALGWKAGGCQGGPPFSHLAGAILSSHGNCRGWLWGFFGAGQRFSYLYCSILISILLNSRIYIARFSDFFFSFLGSMLVDSRISFARFSYSFLSILGSTIARFSYSFGSRVLIIRFLDPNRSILGTMSLDSYSFSLIPSRLICLMDRKRYRVPDIVPTVHLL